mgnify:CR=1 FL=1
MWEVDTVPAPAYRADAAGGEGGRPIGSGYAPRFRVARKRAAPGALPGAGLQLIRAGPKIGRDCVRYVKAGSAQAGAVKRFAGTRRGEEVPASAGASDGQVQCRTAEERQWAEDGVEAPHEFQGGGGHAHAQKGLYRVATKRSAGYSAATSCTLKIR